MIVQKFMRLLLVPGMAVPLVLVACSSDDSHFLMDTAAVGAALENEGIAEKFKSAAGTERSSNAPSRLHIDSGGNLVFEMGVGTDLSSTTVDMTDDDQIEHTLRAGDRVFKGYDIEATLDGAETSGAKLHAVVFAYPDSAADTGMENPLAFGLWMVEPESGMIKVGAFGPRGYDRPKFSDITKNLFPSNMVTKATFSGPSIGVATVGDSVNTFDAMVSLTAMKKDMMSDTTFSLDGTVSDFNGIEMEDITLKSVDLKPTEVNNVSKRVDVVVGDTIAGAYTGKWEVSFASTSSIAGSYGLSNEDEFHLIGSFGAYKKDE